MMYPTSGGAGEQSKTTPEIVIRRHDREIARAFWRDTFGGEPTEPEEFEDFGRLEKLIAAVREDGHREERERGARIAEEVARMCAVGRSITRMAGIGIMKSRPKGDGVCGARKNG